MELGAGPQGESRGSKEAECNTATGTDSAARARTACGPGLGAAVLAPETDIIFVAVEQPHQENRMSLAHMAQSDSVWLMWLVWLPHPPDGPHGVRISNIPFLNVGVIL
ncbi:hypothetical protein K438DRAFT_1765847 [Mycena galopus ATCC 62051]|nr:hypothetical protein K438DRAFT_1765847 [Mycena galopus ATCC 62051]